MQLHLIFQIIALISIASAFLYGTGLALINYTFDRAEQSQKKFTESMVLSFDELAKMPPPDPATRYSA